MPPEMPAAIDAEVGQEWSRTGGASTDAVGYFGPQSLTWRIGRERVMLLGAGRAVLLQLAHPLVAAGVAHHSSFLTDPLGRSSRTIEFTQVMGFGTRHEVHAMARRVNRLHAGVQGSLGRAAGADHADAGYRARDPELLLWVYATLVDTALQLYPLVVQPLTPAEQGQYYQESKRFARLLGIPDDVLPENLNDFMAYMHRMLLGPNLAATPEAMMLGHRLLYLPAPAPLRLGQALVEQFTIGLLPPRARELYGYAWDAQRQRVLDGMTLAIRHLLPLVPTRVRYTPWSRRAKARLRSPATSAVMPD
jgi:uncharacterized protein (DUF2236 family)